MRAEFTGLRDVGTRAIRGALATCGILEASASFVTVDASVTPITDTGGQ
jgi:hypothetical protein